MASGKKRMSTAKLIEKVWKAREAAGHFDDGDNDDLEDSIDTGDRKFRDHQPGQWRHRLWYRTLYDPTALRSRFDSS